MNRIRVARALLFAAAPLALSPVATAGDGLSDEFRHLASSPFPRQHVDARNSDFVAGVHAPLHVEPAWHVFEDRTYTQPCANGPEGHIYCASFHDPKERCNFTALDASNGGVLWEDRFGGECMLDEATAASVPLVDADGHVYATDSKRIVSFTADGQLRWVNDLPGRLEANPPTGRSNAPFGLNVLPTGELVTMTIGDGFILILDRATGALVTEPFDLPAAKQRAADAPERPPGFLESHGSAAGADLAWAFAKGESDNETDNDVSIDSKTGTIFITSAAPAPNPNGDGALWAVRVDPATRALSTAFYVRFPGPGGSATTPTISKDGNFAAVADNDEELVIVDVPRCLEIDPGAECAHFVTVPLGTDLLASPAITPSNRIIASAGADGILAIDLRRDPDGTIVAQEAWRWETRPTEWFERDETGFIWARLHSVTSVVTAYENVAVFAESAVELRGVDWDGVNPDAPFVGTTRTDMVAIDIQTGEESFRWRDAGSLHTATMSADGTTLITIEYNFLSQLFGDRSEPSGVRGWRVADAPSGEGAPAEQR